MLFSVLEFFSCIFQLLVNLCLTITFLLWLLNKLLFANYLIMQRKTCWLIKTPKVLLSWYKMENILILN